MVAARRRERRSAISSLSTLRRVTYTHGSSVAERGVLSSAIGNVGSRRDDTGGRNSDRSRAVSERAVLGATISSRHLHNAAAPDGDLEEVRRCLCVQFFIVGRSRME